METRFNTQPYVKISEIFRENIAASNQVLIASAYLTADGLRQLGIPSEDRVTKIICGVHGCVSDLHALQKFVNSNEDCFRANVFVGANVFHPKLYLFINDHNINAFCGSANCTGQGLSENEEALIELRGNQNDSPITDVIDYFDILWTQHSVSVTEYLKAHPDYAKHDISAFTQPQKRILRGLRQELEAVGKECENQIKKSLRQRQYGSFIFEILLGKSEGKWFTGEEICRAFDTKCQRREVLDKNGKPCKGFAYDYLFVEVIGFKQGKMIECQSEVPEERNKIFPSYKQMKFRIVVNCYEAVRRALQN